MSPARAPSTRPLRVGEEIRHALAEIFARGAPRDPDLADASITFSEVRVSPDLRQATVFVLPLAGIDSAAILKALKRAAPFLRAEVARAVRLRYATQLRFQLDTLFDDAARIEQVLASPHVRQDTAPPKPRRKPKA